MKKRRHIPTGSLSESFGSNEQIVAYVLQTIAAQDKHLGISRQRIPLTRMQEAFIQGAAKV